MMSKLLFMEKLNTGKTDRAIHVTKVLPAPIDLVWKVWTTPEHIAHWWGPNGFTNTIHKMDITANGEWHLTMQGPDGKTYPNKSRFLEIVFCKKIVFEHYHPNYLATIVFEPNGKDTLLDWTMTFESHELFETVVKVFKADEGLSQNVEKLLNYLNQKSNLYEQNP